MTEINLPLILQIIQTTGILVGIVYYITIMRNTQKTRQREMFMQLYNQTYNSEEMKRFWQLMNLEWEDYDDFRAKYGPDINQQEAAVRTVIFNFFEGLGLLVKDNMVDVNTVYSLTGRRIIMVWFKFETIIEGLRIYADAGPDYLENFEFLANEMIRIRTQKGLPLPVGRLHPTSKLHQLYSNP